MFRRFMPVLTLGLLATAIPEILFGSTPLTSPGRILVTMPIYAGGAIVVRELARRRRVGWAAIALLGVAYGIVEEGLTLGSLFNPDLFNAGLVGGRLFGVNWTWTEWTLGYHAVWSISIPILLTELIFPARRADPWLGRTPGDRGPGLSGGGHVPGCHLSLCGGAGLRAASRPVRHRHSGRGRLAILALGRGGTVVTARPMAELRVPSPWLVGLLALIVAGVWFELLLLPQPIKSAGGSSCR